MQPATNLELNRLTGAGSANVSSDLTALQRMKLISQQKTEKGADARRRVYETTKDGKLAVSQLLMD
jgi:DNA-binding transcriptional regulator GbsR (MarR family)